MFFILNFLLTFALLFLRHMGLGTPRRRFANEAGDIHTKQRNSQKGISSLIGKLLFLCFSYRESSIFLSNLFLKTKSKSLKINNLSLVFSFSFRFILLPFSFSFPLKPPISISIPMTLFILPLQSRLYWSIVHYLSINLLVRDIYIFLYRATYINYLL